VDYYIKCGADSSAARVYITVVAAPEPEVLQAVNDTVTTPANTPITISVLANDALGECTVASLIAFDTIADSGLKHGMLTINLSNGTLFYTPDAGFHGIDSVDYYIKCDSDSSAARVYITILESGDLQAVNDTVTTTTNTPVSIDVLANDRRGGCTVASLSAFDTIAGGGPQHGTLTVNSIDGTLLYTPDAGFHGIDSADYYIKCGADSSAARVYMAALKPSAASYVACQYVAIAMNVEAAGADIYWYAQPTGGTPNPTGASNAKTVVKGGDPLETYWVEARYGAILFPRRRIELRLSLNCGTVDPTDCAADGTLIWKEDFGGNDPDDPRVSPTGLPDGTTDIEFSSVNEGDGYGYGKYWILKYNVAGAVWHKNFSDHTHPGDTGRGYFCMVDPNMGGNRLYRRKLENLCGGNMFVSLWALVVNDWNINIPILTFTIFDSADGVIASFTTNNIPLDDPGPPTWRNYGFAFTVPAECESLTLEIGTYTPNTYSGYDFALDDIEVRLCVPPVTITRPSTGDTAVCAGSQVAFAGEYADDGTFGDNLSALWQYSETGNVNNHDEWLNLPMWIDVSSGKAVSGINFEADAGHAGYYRMVAADEDKVFKPNCRASSKLIRLEVKTCALHAVNDTAATVAGVPISIAALANDTLGNCTIASLTAFDTIADSGLKHGTLTINPGDGTLLYVPDAGYFGRDSVDYYIKCATDSSAARVYITILESSALQAVNDTVTTMVNTPITVHVLANDKRGECYAAPLSAFDTIAGSGLQHGTLTIDPIDSSFVYTPAAGYFGRDSVDYYIKCGTDSSAARVYITILEPEALQAVNDTVTTMVNTLVTVHVLANDKRGNCYSASLSAFDTIAGSGLKH
jgi:ribosome-binding factor A